MKKLLILTTIMAGAAMAQSSPHSVTLNWQPGTGGVAPTGYNVKRTTVTGGPYTVVGTTTAPTTTYVDPFLFTDEGKKFYYVVSATANGMESPNSAEVSATIPFSAPETPTTPTVSIR